MPDHPHLPPERLLRWPAVRLQLRLPPPERKVCHRQCGCALLPRQLLFQRSFMHLQLRILPILHRSLRNLPRRNQLGRLTVLLLHFLLSRIRPQPSHQPMRALCPLLRCQLLLQRSNLRLHNRLQPDQRSLPTVRSWYYLRRLTMLQ